METTKTLGTLFEGVEDRLDKIEDALDQLLDLARSEGLAGLRREPDYDDDTDDLRMGYGSGADGWEGM